jgi:hypothetical protein
MSLMEFNPSVIFGPRWGWLSIWGIFIIVLLIFATVAGVGVHPWSDVSGASVATYHKEQCESVDTTGFFVQFHNFWSNSAYLAAGLLIVWLSNSGVCKAIGWVFVFLSFTSAWFHGTLTLTGRTFDMVGVYCALMVLIAYAIIESIPLDQDGLWSWVVFIIAALVGFFAGILRPGGLFDTPVKFFDSDTFTPLLVVVLIVAMVLVKYHFWHTPDAVHPAPLWPPIIGFFGTGVLALIFKFTDGDDNGQFADHHGQIAQCFYDPHGLIQGHALWHFLSAVMFVCCFEYIRSVNGRSRSVFPWRIKDDAGGS